VESKDAIGYLQKKIRTYELSISRLMAQIDALEAEVNTIEILLNSARALLMDELGKTRVPGSLKITSDQEYERLSVLSFSDAIIEIVNNSPGQIHADQVLKKLREAGKVSRAKNPKNSVVSLLHRGVKSGLIKKVGANLFARIEE
jgi:hypothetical protein